MVANADSKLQFDFEEGTPVNTYLVGGDVDAFVRGTGHVNTGVVVFTRPSVVAQVAHAVEVGGLVYVATCSTTTHLRAAC